jgi:hypothetical protein
MARRRLSHDEQLLGRTNVTVKESEFGDRRYIAQQYRYDPMLDKVVLRSTPVQINNQQEPSTSSTTSERSTS